MSHHPAPRQWGVRTAGGVVSHARDEEQARRWLAYDHRAHLNPGEVLVAKYPHETDWAVVTDAPAAAA